jgi:hypothetical protein
MTIRHRKSQLTMNVLFIFNNIVLYLSVGTPAFARKTAPQMIPVEATEIISSVAQNAQLIATNADEFGGYFYPVAGIGLLATLILYLSPPLADN